MRTDLFERFNPTIKSITIIIGCVLMAIGGTWRINAAVIISCILALLFLSKCSLRTMMMLYLPLLFLGGAIFLSSYLSSDAMVTGEAAFEMGSYDTALLLGTRILSYASFGILFGLTTDHKLFAMSLMHQLHLKPKFAYGVLAALHLVPALQREWDEVRLAYAVRRKRTGILPLGPLFNTLVNGIRWSENVAMAMESKGFDGAGARTFSVETPVRWFDLLYAGSSTALMVLFVLFLSR